MLPEIELINIILLIILIITVALYTIRYPEDKVMLSMNLAIIAINGVSIFRCYDNYKVKKSKN